MNNLFYFSNACGLTINVGDVGDWIEKESNLYDNACRMFIIKSATKRRLKCIEYK